MRTAAAIFLIAATASAQTPAPADKPMEETKKNIKMLRGVPSSQLIPLMSFMANSLGVTCAHCHNTKAYESDEKPEKETARRMIAMQRAMNEQYYGGKLTITCNTCHHGRSNPPATPDLASAAWNQAPAVADKSVEAEEALPRLFASAPARRIVRGVVERYNGRDEPKSAPFTLTLDGEKVSYNTELSHPPEASRALLVYLLTMPAPERVRGERWTLAPDLIKRTRETPTILGTLPEEITYGDYRDGGAARLPYRAQWSRADYRVTFTIQSIDDARPPDR
jgi:hypothetical protein